MVIPGIVNVMGLPAVNVPALNVRVNTLEAIAALPVAPDAGEENTTAVLARFVNPLTVMIILPLLATAEPGVRVTLMVTLAADAATLLRVMTGVPENGTASRIAGNVPEVLEPTTVVPSFAVVASAIVVDAACAAAGLVKPGMVNVIGTPAVKVPEENVTVRTLLAIAAVPAAPDAGEEKVSVPAPTIDGDPVRVMIIFPLLATSAAGIRLTLTVTPVAPFTTLLRVMVGDNKVVPVMMAG